MDEKVSYLIEVGSSQTGLGRCFSDGFKNWYKQSTQPYTMISVYSKNNKVRLKHTHRKKGDNAQTCQKQQKPGKSVPAQL